MKKGDRENLVKKAKRKAQEIKELRKDPRCDLVLGRLVHENLLDAPRVRGHRRKFLLEEALWVGTHIEPRVLELLPALVLKRPGIMLFEKLPDDLNDVVISLRNGKPKREFRGISVKSYSQWLPKVGRSGTYPSVSKTFRFSQQDRALLANLSKKMVKTETEVVRLALRNLEKVC